MNRTRQSFSTTPRPRFLTKKKKKILSAKKRPAHTPCRGGPWTISLRRGPTPKRVPHRVPNPARRTFRHVSRFASPLHGVPSPTIRSFRIVSRFGSPLHGVPNPTMRSFRVVSCFTGCPIPELRLCQQQVHRLSRYGCVLLCVSRQCAEPHAPRTPPQHKNSLAVTPIYHFHFNLYFLKAPRALRWSQAPRHSVTSHAPACAPRVIFYFRCLLESLLDFRSGACRFCATEAATSAFPLFTCLACPRGCFVVFLYTFLGRNGCLTPAVSGIPTASERGDKIRSGPLVGKMATSPLPYRGSPPLQSGGTKSEVAHKWAKWLPHPCRIGDPHRCRAGGQNRKWPTSGQNGDLTPAVSGIPTAAERGDKIRSGPQVGKMATSPLPYWGSPPLQSGGTKSEVAHKRAKWLPHPCRLGDPHRIRAGGQNQKWPTCGQNGYLTPAVSGIPTAS